MPPTPSPGGTAVRSSASCWTRPAPQAVSSAVIRTLSFSRGRQISSPCVASNCDCCAHCGRCWPRAGGSCMQPARYCAQKMSRSLRPSLTATPVRLPSPFRRALARRGCACRTTPASRSCPEKRLWTASIMLAWKSAEPGTRSELVCLIAHRLRNSSNGDQALRMTACFKPILCFFLLRVRGIVLASVVACLPATLVENAWAEAAPQLGVRTAYVQLVEGVYLLHARLQLPLSNKVRAALVDGVPLTLVLELEVSRARHYWLDEGVASLRQEYQLQYQAVSDRYVVRNLKRGELSS